MTGETAEIQYNRLKILRQPHVVTVTLDSPTTHNRIDSAMAAEVRDVCQAIAEDEAVRLVIITGSGDRFSVGRESPPETILSGASVEVLSWIAERQVASCLAGLQVPVLAAINGDALDHGLELALAADIRIAASDAKFGLASGTFPFDGGTQRLPRIVGPAWARDMIFTGRVLDAAEAQNLGLVSRVVERNELLNEAGRLAEAVLAGGPIAARYAKEAVHVGMELTLPQGLRLEADLNILLHSTADRVEGLQSFRERRKPSFHGE